MQRFPREHREINQDECVLTNNYIESNDKEPPLLNQS